MRLVELLFIAFLVLVVGRKSTRNFIPKTDHEKQVLKSVADKIYGLLKTDRIEGKQESRGEGPGEPGYLMSSLLSMVMGHEGPSVETETRVLEILAHVIADVSEKFQKHQDGTDFAPQAPNISPKVLLSDGIKTEKKMEKPVKVLGLVESKMGIKTPAEGKPISLLPSKETGSKEKQARTLTMEKIENHETKMSLDPVLKLTPHVLFTDTEGGEYRLVGLGNRSGKTCQGQCLGIEPGSKHVLAYKAPMSAEYLVLVNHAGEEFYTSGVQLCDEPVSAKQSRHVRGQTNLALLTPQNMKDVNSNLLTVKWNDEAKEVKREGAGYQDVDQDVKNLFNGPGMTAVPNDKVRLSPQEVLDVINGKTKMSRRRRKARLMKLRREKSEQISRKNLDHIRSKRESDEYSYYDDERMRANRDYLRPIISKKIPSKIGSELLDSRMEDLKVDKKNLDESSKSETDKVGIERCKRQCETQVFSKNTGDVPDFDKTKRSSVFDLLPYPVDRSLQYNSEENGIDWTPREFLGLQPISSDHRVGLNEEINMIQPNAAPEEETKILFRNNSSVGNENLTLEQMQQFGNKDPTTNEVYYDESSATPGRDQNLPTFEPDLDLLYINISQKDPLLNKFLAHSKMSELELEEALSGAFSTIRATTVSTTPSIMDAVQVEEIGDVARERPESGSVGVQLTEAMLFIVQNTHKMKELIGTGLSFKYPLMVQNNFPATHSTHYKPSLNLLIKTLMVNVKKIVEEDVEHRTCLKLETALQFFLSSLLGLSENRTFPKQFVPNIKSLHSYEKLNLHKNELLDLLKDYQQLPSKEQENAIGVKTMIEKELQDIKRQIADKKETARRRSLNSYYNGMKHTESPERHIGSHINILPSPSLVIDLTKVSSNCRAMLERFSQFGIRLRPHIKTHKTIQGALLQTGGRRCGIVVSTLDEALFYLEHGFDDIVVGRPVTPHFIQRCTSLLAQTSSLHFLVNSVEGLQAVLNAGTNLKPISALLKVSAGYERAGISWKETKTIFEFASKLTNSAQTKFEGIYSHCGNSYTTTEHGVETVRNDTVKRLLLVRDYLHTRGIDCRSIGLGSTPSCSLKPSPAMSQLTEVHCGNYIFYDCQQEGYKACRREDIAVRVLTRVVSHHPSRNQLLVDLGFTGLTKQGLDQVVPGYGAVDGFPNLKLVAMTQELGKLETVDGSGINYAQFPVDSVLYIYPYHSCATAGMYNHYYIHDAQGVVCDVWRPTRGW